MKCTNCGAEIGENRHCDYCGAQISSEMLREQELMKKTGCPKCGSTNVSFNRENQGEIRGKNGKRIVHYTVGVCKDCGYTWRSDVGPATKERKTWLWVLGWLLIFPLPLTLILIKKKDMKPALKYGIIAVAWLAFLGLGFAANGSTTATQEKSVWADSITPLSDFEYYIDGTEIYLKDYHGSSKKVRISSSYDVEGKAMKVVSLDGTFTLENVTSVILPEGVKSISANCFNSCGIDYLYIPLSLEDIPNTFWGYFHDMEKIYYGGTEVQWSNICTVERNKLDVKQVVFETNSDTLK